MRVDITVELRATPDNTMRERAIITTNGCGREDHSHSQKTLEDLGSELRARVGNRLNVILGLSNRLAVILGKLAQAVTGVRGIKLSEIIK